MKLTSRKQTSSTGSEPIKVLRISLAYRFGMACTLLAACLLACQVKPVYAAEPNSAASNILFVIADDFGLDASPCYPVGSEKPKMPTLEALCKQGVVFDNVWAYPVCTPTRASILTGQFGIHTQVMQVDDLLAPTPTILQALAQKTSPYASAVVGKWHIAGPRPDPNHPALFGAQHYAGFLTGALRDYFSWDVTINGKTQRESRYSTTALTQYAIDWIAIQKQPWFVWLAYNAPHAPFHVPPAELHSQSTLKSGGTKSNHAMYFAAAEAMDSELGRLLASLPETVRSKTVVVFMGDNGTPRQVVQGPYQRNQAKGSLYQGGINVPMVIAGAGVSRAGQREVALINSTDLFATFASLTKINTKVPKNSVSFAAALTSNSFEGRSHAYMDFRENGRVKTAIRDSRYKLIEQEGGQRQLFDLRTDPYETQDLLATDSQGNTSSSALQHIVTSLIHQRNIFQK